MFSRHSSYPPQKLLVGRRFGESDTTPFFVDKTNSRAQTVIMLTSEHKAGMSSMCVKGRREEKPETSALTGSERLNMTYDNLEKHVCFIARICHIDSCFA